MASSTQDTLRCAKFRLCRLKKWPNFNGLGFDLEAGPEPPHRIQFVESNSPAAAAGLRILDVILAVNKEDTTKVTFDQLKKTIKSVLDKQDTVEFLVIEKRQYVALTERKVSFDRKYAQVLETPNIMSDDYANFPPNTPRTCNVRLSLQDQSLYGMELVTGEWDTGAYVQDVVPGGPTSRANLRKSDRIIEMDGYFVNDQPYSQILAGLKGAKANGGVKLYVMDTATYKYYTTNKIPLASGGQYDGQSVDGDGSEPDDDADEPDDDASVHRRGQPETPPNDIRLCTITKTNATQSYGIALTYELAQRQHTLKIIPGKNNEPSRGYIAGVREGDRLIEVNGENVQNMADADVKIRFRVVMYPDPLALLVASPKTADYYKRNGKLITSDLGRGKQHSISDLDPDLTIQPQTQDTSALYNACRDNSIDLVEYYLQKMSEAEINRVEPNGSTALHVAAYRGHEKIVELLLQKGASYTTINKYNCTPLDEAKTDRVKKLIRRRMNTNRFASESVEWVLSTNDADFQAQEYLKKLEAYGKDPQFDKLIALIKRNYLERELQDVENIDTVTRYFDMAITDKDPIHLLTAYTAETGFYSILNRHVARLNLDTLTTEHNINRAYYIGIIVHHPKFKQFAYKGRSYRGMVITESDLKQYKRGTRILTKTFSSTSKQRNVASRFLSTDVQRDDRLNVICIYEIRNRGTALDIQLLSEYQDEEEVLILPYSAFKIIDIKQNRHNLPRVEIELKECEPS